VAHGGDKHVTTNPDYWTIAERVLNQRQLEAIRLYDRGLSYQTIALHMAVSTQRAHQLVKRAAFLIKLEQRKEPAA
jgi:predicted DNA-binding protein (UPF0251 family)